jgi:hypothetical protein
MSFGPKPVNFALNRDMLGKVLMHTREDMAAEVDKMTFKTLYGRSLTIAQVRSFLARSDLILCVEPTCKYNCLAYVDEFECCTCVGCKQQVCLDHRYFVNHSNWHNIHACDKCKPTACADCGTEFHYSDDRVAVHRCNVANN